MPSYAGPLPSARSGEVVETLRLLAYLVVALVLVVLDHRGGWLRQARGQVETLLQPVRLVAGLPGRMVERVADDAGTLGQLTEENARLRRALLVNQARMARMQTVAADNARLRALLDAAQRDRLDVQLAPILDIDLDPTRQRLVLAAGTRDGVRVGQTVLDAGGLVGQVIEAGPLQSTVLLLTDASHAVPVTVARTGVRLVAYGDGRSDALRLPTVPTSSDVRVGDALVTSGLGGRFEAGFPVGTITALAPDDSRAFLAGTVRPAAQFDRGREVLLLRAGAPVRVRPGGLAGVQGTDVTARGVDGPVASAASAMPAMPVTHATPAMPATPVTRGDSTPSPPPAGERVGARGASGLDIGAASRTQSFASASYVRTGRTDTTAAGGPLTPTLVPADPRGGPAFDETRAGGSQASPPTPARGGEGAQTRSPADPRSAGAVASPASVPPADGATR